MILQRKDSGRTINQEQQLSALSSASVAVHAEDG